MDLKVLRLWAICWRARRIMALAFFSCCVLFAACTQESQNRFSRSIQNWTGTNGVLDIYAGEKLVLRFIEIDKISTAAATGGEAARPYRFGYGFVDTNFNFSVDEGEKKVYFEFSDYSTSYVFYENYRE